MSSTWGILFAGQVLLASGARTPVHALCVGDHVRVPWPFAGVATIVVRERTVCAPEDGGLAVVQCPGGAWLTAAHPVFDKHAGRWVNAGDAAAPRSARRLVRTVYNFVLDAGHALDVDGLACITLGHGRAEPGLAHPHWGTRAVVDELRAQPDWPADVVHGPRWR